MAMPKPENSTSSSEMTNNSFEMKINTFVVVTIASTKEEQQAMEDFVLHGKESGLG